MRSNFLKNINLTRIIKITDIIMAVMFAIFWVMIAVLMAYNFFERKYIYPIKYKEIVFECADNYGLDRALVFAVIDVESSFNKDNVSSAGAVGLMQITPATAEYIAKLNGVEQFELIDAKTNVNFGCFYLRYLFDKFVELDTVICAYNAGEGKVSNWLKNKEYSLDGKTLINIPFKETQEYREKIHKSYKKYTQLYKNILDKR